MEDSEMTVLQFAERRQAIEKAERALDDAAMIYSRGHMSETAGALRGLIKAAQALADAREAPTPPASGKGRDGERL